MAVTTSDREEFVRLTDPYRRELLAFCYRMLGSVDEAEDLVQETYLRAWRSCERYEGRASMRTWLHRIATNTCLTELDRRVRRPLPSGLGGPSQAPEGALKAPVTDVPWLEPLPDALVDPASVVAARGSLRLAMVAALQHLPARQRAVLILRDVLSWRASEVASLLGTSQAAVKSALQRARSRLEEIAPDEDLVVEPGGAADREVLDRYMAALENADMDALLDLLQDGVELEMPPHPDWFRGSKDVLKFLHSRRHEVGDCRMLPTRANGQSAALMYCPGKAGRQETHSVHVLTVRHGTVARITIFLGTEQAARFGFPVVLP
jgi:RNA polymerase sigma-70 factor (ECF subfamily)